MLAERARLPAEQQDCLVSRQRVLQDRVLFEQRFASRLQAEFNHLSRSAVEKSETPAVKPWQSLELLDTLEQECSMAVEQLGIRGESRHSEVLQDLGYRIAVLMGAPPLEASTLPLGPHALARAFHETSNELKLPVGHHLLMLQSFDQHVIPSLAPLYEAVNALLLGDGILPQLRSTPLPRQLSQHRRGTPEIATEAADAASRKSVAAQGDSIEVLESLRDLLAQQRAHHGSNGAEPAGRTASEDELQTALGALQHHLAQVTDKASREIRSAQRLREELLAQLNVDKPGGALHTELSGEQNDTVELVAMLFEQLGQQLKQGGDAQALLGDMQLPVLRMAAADHEFFEKNEHPARQVLDAVAVAASEWLDDNDDATTRPLAEKLGQLVQRVNQEPPSTGLYTTLLADIEHHLGLLTRKAQTAERRHVEAAKGRDRLDQARRQAADMIADRITQSPPDGLLRTVLDRAWSDVLALTLLRHGRDSDPFKAQLAVTDQLLGLLPIEDPLALQMEVMAGLQQIGMHTQEASQVTRQLLGSPHVPQAPSVQNGKPSPPGADTTKTPDSPRYPSIQHPRHEAVFANNSSPGTAPGIIDLADRLQRHQRLGKHDDDDIRSTPDITASSLSPQQAQIHSRLLKVPFGTWFEFLDPETGKRTQRKLAWFSPVSGNILFVTRRGIRGNPMNLCQLACAIADGQAHELSQQNDSMLDRAWHNLTHSLRQGAGHPRASKHESERP